MPWKVARLSFRVWMQKVFRAWRESTEFVMEKGEPRMLSGTNPSAFWEKKGAVGRNPTKCTVGKETDPRKGLLKPGPGS